MGERGPRFVSGYEQPKFLEDTKLPRPVNGSSGRIGGTMAGVGDAGDSCRKHKPLGPEPRRISKDM